MGLPTEVNFDAAMGKPQRGKARFYSMDKPNGTHPDGRPKFDKVICVKVMNPGVDDVDLRATEGHKQKYAEAWAAFQRNEEPITEGTPLHMWANPQCMGGRIEELAHYNIRTVEDLAQAPLNALRQMGPGMLKIHAEAKEYISDNSQASRALMALKRHVKILEAQIEKYRGDFEGMSQIVAEKTGEPYVASPVAPKPKAKAKRKTKAKKRVADG